MEVKLLNVDDKISYRCHNEKCDKWLEFSFWKFKEIAEQVEKDKKDSKKKNK